MLKLQCPLQVVRDRLKEAEGEKERERERKLEVKEKRKRCIREPEPEFRCESCLKAEWHQKNPVKAAGSNKSLILGVKLPE